MSYPSPPSMPRRGSSNADRYKPTAYANPPFQQPDPDLLGPYQQPYPPAGTSPRPNPPYPVEQSMIPVQANMPLVPQQQQPPPRRYSNGSPAPPHETSRRPSYTGSSHARRSQDSHRSHHSRHVAYADETDYIPDERGHDHHHHHRHEEDSDEAYRQRLRDRGENVRPTLGDTVMTMLSPLKFLKYLIEPRDKV